MAGTGSLDLVTTDAGELYNEALEIAQDACGETLMPGDERRIFIEAVVGVLVPLTSSIQDAARQVMLTYARGEVLDALGERLGVSRLAGTAATCTLRFELSAVRKVATAIPAGTKARTDGDVYFATTVDAIVAAGETSVEVPAECTEPGAAANALGVGAVSAMVDLIPYVGRVENVDDTAGGDDGELYDEDGDDRYRERIRLAPERLSVAGPVGAYEYWAKTADASISDVAVLSELEEIARECEVRDGHAFVGGDQLRPDLGVEVDGEPESRWTYEHALLDVTTAKPGRVTVSVHRDMAGLVRIVPLLEGGGVPDADVLRRVEEAVGARDVRPMTDVVEVSAPGTVDYDIDLTYWTTVTAEGAVVDAVEGDGGAIDAYVAEQCARLGRDVEPDKLVELVMAAGAYRCEVRSPERATVEDWEVARFSGSLAATHEVVATARWDR